MKAYYHLPGLFEFYELYKEFLPLYRKHREYFYDWCEIGSIYGAPADCVWGGGRVGFGEHDPKEVLKLMQEYGISARLTFSNSLLTKEHLPDKKCNELCRIFDIGYKANVIDLFAVGDSFLSALMFEHKMTYVNKLVNLKIIPTEQTQQALYTTKNSVALIISYSGQTNEIKPIVERIKINGGTIIAITSLNDSYLRIKADICLTMCSKENIINKIGTFSSKISSDYIIDLIYSLLFKKNYQELLIKKVSMNLDWDERRNESTHEKGKGE